MFPFRPNETRNNVFGNKIYEIHYIKNIFIKIETRILRKI